MGVNGLWKLLRPCGRKLSLEDLRGKRIAIDMNIWLHQAAKSRSQFLLLLFRRICKLLYFGIKPVFVFDGDVPVLKRMTMQKRNRQRHVAKEKAVLAHERLIKRLMKRIAEESLGVSTSKSNVKKLDAGTLLSQMQRQSASLDALDVGHLFQVAEEKLLQQRQQPSLNPANKDNKFEQVSQTDELAHSYLDNLLHTQSLREEEDGDDSQQAWSLDMQCDSFQALPLAAKLRVVQLAKMHLDNRVEPEQRSKLCENVNECGAEDATRFSRLQMHRLMERRNLTREERKISHSIVLQEAAPILSQFMPEHVADDRVETVAIQSRADEHAILVNLDKGSNDKSAIQARLFRMINPQPSSLQKSTVKAEKPEMKTPKPLESGSPTKEDEEAEEISASVSLKPIEIFPEKKTEEAISPCMKVEEEEEEPSYKEELLEEQLKPFIEEPVAEEMRFASITEKQKMVESEEEECEEKAGLSSSSDDDDDEFEDVVEPPQPMIESKKLLEQCHPENVEETALLIDDEDEFQLDDACLQYEAEKLDRFAQTTTTKFIDDSKILLKLFGLPYVESVEEAEAQCAWLEQKKLVDMVATEDSDVWLFGAQTVCRNLFGSREPELYDCVMLASQLGLSRANLIRVAMLCGSDYTEGIANVGPVTAVEVLSEFCPKVKQQASVATLTSDEVVIPLEEFKNWIIDRQQSTPSSQDVVKAESSPVKRKWLKFELPEAFPNPTVAAGYLKPNVQERTRAFRWFPADLEKLTALAKDTFGWTEEKAQTLLQNVLQHSKAEPKQLNSQALITDSFKRQPTMEVVNEASVPSKRVRSATSNLLKH